MDADWALGRVVLLLVLCAGIGWVTMGVAVGKEWAKEGDIVSVMG